MFGLDDVAGVADDVLGGTPWGWGVAAVAAVALIGGRQAKPLAKGAIKGYFAVTRVTRQWAAVLGDAYQLRDTDCLDMTVGPEGRAAKDAADAGWTVAYTVLFEEPPSEIGPRVFQSVCE